MSCRIIRHTESVSLGYLLRLFYPLRVTFALWYDARVGKLLMRGGIGAGIAGVAFLIQGLRA